MCKAWRKSERKEKKKINILKEGKRKWFGKKKEIRKGRKDESS